MRSGVEETHLQGLIEPFAYTRTFDGNISALSGDSAACLQQVVRCSQRTHKVLGS